VICLPGDIGSCGVAIGQAPLDEQADGASEPAVIEAFKPVSEPWISIIPHPVLMVVLIANFMQI